MNTKLTAVIFSLLLLCGCTSKTEFGDCIGVTDDKIPTLNYKVSEWNIFLAVIGFEMILPPIFVLFDEVQCPVSVKQ